MYMTDVSKKVSKRRAICLLLFVCGVYICTATQHVIAAGRFTNRDQIEQKKVSIAKAHSFGKKVDHGLLGIIAAVGVWFAYTWVKHMFHNNQQAKNVEWWNGLNIVQKCKATKNMIMVPRFLALEKTVYEQSDPSFLSIAWFKRVFKKASMSFFTSSFAAIAFKGFEVFYKRYHCFDTLQQFLDTRFAGLKILDELLYNARLYDHLIVKNAHTDEFEQAKNRLIVSVTNIAFLFESIIAFMEYKIDEFDSSLLSKEDLQLPDYVFKSLQNFCLIVEQILVSGVQLKDVEDADQTMFAVSSNFKTDVIRLVESFKGLESRVAWFMG